MTGTKQYMSLREIQELIKMLGKSNISEISIEREKFKITLRTHEANRPAPVVVQANPVPVPPVISQPAAPAVSSAPEKEIPPGIEVPKSTSEDTSKYITIKSPMIGTFYRTPSPDKPPCVNVGDEINTGSVLCVIEAMKLFNEIESEHSGRIVKILVENAKPVEYDQPLFLIEPV